MSIVPSKPEQMTCLGPNRTKVRSKVEEIRQRVAQGAQKTDLAKECGISRQTLYASLRVAGAG